MSTTLNFNDGRKRLAINGDESRIITVNPTDISIVSRYSETVPKLEELVKKYSEIKSEITIDEAVKINNELDAEAKKFIDYIVGSPVSDVAFGTANCLSYAGGQTIFENFLTAYMEYMEPNIKSEYEKSKKRVSKYTNQIKK